MGQISPAPAESRAYPPATRLPSRAFGQGELSWRRTLAEEAPSPGDRRRPPTLIVVARPSVSRVKAESGSAGESRAQVFAASFFVAVRVLLLRDSPAGVWYLPCLGSSVSGADALRHFLSPASGIASGAELQPLVGLPSVWMFAALGNSSSALGRGEPRAGASRGGLRWSLRGPLTRVSDDHLNRGEDLTARRQQRS
jgi:hypothetical protein